MSHVFSSFSKTFPLKYPTLRSILCLNSGDFSVDFQLHKRFVFNTFPPLSNIIPTQNHSRIQKPPSIHSFSVRRCKWTLCQDWCEEIFFVYEKNYIEKKCSISCFFIPIPQNSKMAATSVIVLDRSNNTTCTINLHGKYYWWKIKFDPGTHQVVGDLCLKGK